MLNWIEELDNVPYVGADGLCGHSADNIPTTIYDDCVAYNEAGECVRVCVGLLLFQVFYIAAYLGH